METAGYDLLFVVTGPFTRQTSSTEARGSNLIRAIRVEVNGGEPKSSEIDRIEFSPQTAILAANLDKSGNWISVVSSRTGCGIARVPWTSTSLLELANANLGRLPSNVDTLDRRLDSILALREKIQAK